MGSTAFPATTRRRGWKQKHQCLNEVQKVEIKNLSNIKLDNDEFLFHAGTSTKDGKVYALHSYCAHLGANLGIGGKVVNNKCIQCPFHGWLYDG